MINDTTKKLLQREHTNIEAALDRTRATLADRELDVKNIKEEISDLEARKRDIVAELQAADVKPESGETRRHSVMDDVTRRTI